MKNYKIIATSVTGLKGKQLMKDQVHAETEFINEHIPDLVKNGFIEEYIEVAEAAEDRKKK